jgi:hypothetical protein
LDPAARTRQALAWFDLGYALATGRQLGFSDREDGSDYLDKASEIAPDDLALHFGLALAYFEPGSRKAAGRTAEQTQRSCYEHLALALQTKEPRLERNLLSTFGVFLQCETHDQLLAKVRGKLGGA